jgi:hypothetical protein
VQDFQRLLAHLTTFKLFSTATLVENCLCWLNFSAIGGISIGILLMSLAILLAIFVNIHQFLAKNAPIDADILVVEGWLPDYAIDVALDKFRQGSYDRVVTIGGPISRGSYLFKYQTFAELAAATLQERGLDPQYLLAVPYCTESTNRTYDTATDLKVWLHSAQLQFNSIDLLTLGTHSRRSWILFKKAFEPEVKIGTIAVEPLHYDSRQWWKSSEGARTILSEFIAYIYTRLFIIRFF